MKAQLTGILLLALITLTGCVKETLDRCPTGNVRIDLYVEKFQTNTVAPAEDAEAIFNQRIQFLQCVLYKDNKYFMDTLIPDVTVTTGPYFTFFLPDLDFGDYELVVFANCDPGIMQGDFHTPGMITLTYPGVEKMQDIFAANLSFTMDCNCTQEFQAKLRRLEGVIRFSFRSLPTDVQEAEVTISGVNSSLGKGGVYSKGIDAVHRFPVSLLTRSTDPGMQIGVFPTTPGTPATFRLRLFRDSGEVAAYDQVSSDKVDVLRNQLVELLSDFSNGQLSFEVKLDTRWEDLINGGEVEAP